MFDILALMSLSYKDLQEIRKIVEETIQPIAGELEALGSDIKEIYSMIFESQKTPRNTSMQKLSLENKILKLHADLVEAAKQAGVNTPSN